MVITNLKIEFLKIKFKRKTSAAGIKGKRQGHTILENRSDSEKKENMTMRKWRTLLAGLVLTFAVSAMAACGTNNDKVNDTTNGTGTESTVNGTGTTNGANGTTNGTANGTNGTTNGTNGTANGTVNDTNGTLNDNGAMDNNGAADNNGNGNVVDDVVDGVGEAGKDVINGVENGVDDLTGNDNNNNGTTDNNGNGR